MPEARPAAALRPGWALPALLLVLLAPLTGRMALLPVAAGALLVALAVNEHAWKPALRAVAGPWLIVFGTATLLLAWPLSALAARGSLAAALTTSAVLAGLLLAAWRSWPLWSGIATGRHGVDSDWRQKATRDPTPWHGLYVALPLTLLVAGGLALGWTSLLPAGVRWGLAAVLTLVLALPLLPRLRRAANHAARTERLGRKPLRNAERIELEALRDAAGDADVSALPAATTPATTDAAAGASATPIDPARATAELFEAARGGRVEHALQLLADGADALAMPDADERDQRSLAQLAAVLPDLRLLRALIERGAPIAAGDGRPGVLLAATRDSWHGRPEAVMTLLANGADAREQDAEGNTPLHHAARSTDPGVAALLLDAGAQIDALNHARQSPLAMACQAGNWRLARFLVERGAQPHPAGGEPVLIAAASGEDDDPAGVEFLLQRKAAVDAHDQAGRSALLHAAPAGHLLITQALLDAGADAARRDEEGMDAWLLAAGSGRRAVLEALLDAGADARARDLQERDALAHALAGGHADAGLLTWLRELGLDPRRPDASGRSTLDVAIEQGRWTLVAALDPTCPLPGVARDDDGEAARPPMQLMLDALEGGERTAVAEVAALLEPEELGRTLLDVAARVPAHLPLLLSQHPPLDARDPAGDSALFLLLDQAGDADARNAIRVLLDAGASPGGRAGLARYLAACLRTRVATQAAEELALRLVDAGADAFAPDARGDAPLALALRLDWTRLAGELLARGADPNRGDSRGLAPLHLAATFGQAALLRQLLRHGAQPATRAGDGQTALGVALAAGHRELEHWLDWSGWPHPGRALRAADLPSAAILGDAAGVRRLLELGFDVNARDSQGCSALLRAAGGGHDPVVADLLAAGADTALTSDSGASALSAAVSMRHLEVIERLLAHGVDLGQRLRGDVTVLMLACALGLADVAARLIAAGADLDAGDAEGLRPIHCAALFGFSSADRARLLALLDTLLLAGADPDQSTLTGLTPLLLLLGARAEPDSSCHEDVLLAGVERLLEEGASLQASDPRGFGPLHLAALHGLGRCVRLLLAAGADPQQRDRLNRTPREIALMRGFMDVAAEFDPSGSPSPSMARFLHPPR